jgi:hypothetical protein
MDILEELIGVLSQEERKEFRLFLQRYQKKKPEKVLALLATFDQKKTTRKERMPQLYPTDQNQVAYHATRKRLVRQLTEFVFLQQQKEVLSTDKPAEVQMLTAKYLFDRGAEQAGWDFLRQAELSALKSEAYLLLNTIYSLQIEKSLSEYAPPLEAILEKKHHAQTLAQEEDRAHIAHHLIRRQMMQSLREGSELDMVKVLSETLKKYKLTQILPERPKMLFDMVSMVRSAALFQKDFYSFEPYIIHQFETAQQKNVFNRYNHRYKVHLLYMIAHVLYRNRKFEQSFVYLEQFYKSLGEHSRNQYYVFYPRYCLLKAALLNYTNQNSEAIECLQNFLKEKSFIQDKKVVLNVYLNLSTYFFQQKQYRSSISTFQNVQHSDVWLSKIMGREWVLKKNIIECINQFELGNHDLVENRIKSMLRNFKDLFERKVYKRIKTFLLLVDRLNENPLIATTLDFRKEVEESFDFIETEREDLQAMAFYGWLKSKMERKDYYEALLELVQYS